MSDDEPRGYEYRDQALIVLPGLSWEEWVSLWNTVEAQHKNINWWVGDVLVAGRAAHGEAFAQVVDEKYLNQQKGALWVAERIPPRERVEGVSWSAHRETASLDSATRAEILGLAKANKWGTREVAEEIRRRKRGGNQGPPLDEETAIEEAHSTWNQPDPDPVEPDTFGETEDVAGEPLQAPLVSVEPAPLSAEADPASPTSTALPAPVSPEAERLRECIADLRALAPKLLRTHVDTIARLEDRITDALGLEPGAMPLLHTEGVLKMLPKGWQYAVTLTRPGEQIAVGLGPSLSCAVVEAILAAKLSDMRVE